MTRVKRTRQWIFQPKPLAAFDHYRRISLAAMLSCLGGFGPVPEITSARKYPLYTEVEDALIASVVTEAIMTGRRYGATNELMERLGRSEASVNNRVCRLRKQGRIPPKPMAVKWAPGHVGGAGRSRVPRTMPRMGRGL